MALVAALLPLSSSNPVNAANGGGLFPWQLDDGSAGVAPIGAGFVLEESDLQFILEQVLIGEQHALTATAGDPCGTLIGPGPNQIPASPNAEQLPLGIRTVNGICNNLATGQLSYGAADEAFIRLTAPHFRTADTVTVPPAFDFNGAAFPNLGDVTSYSQTTGWVEDAEPRMISNLIANQTTDNPAAVGAATSGIPGDLDGDGVMPPDPDAHMLEGGACPGVATCDALFIENVATDEGLSAPFNSMFTFFGQFFDHGLDLTTKSGDFVYMPLHADDPLFDPTPGAPNFMLLSRATNDVMDPENRTTPFVDQQQTYTSTPSHQVFNREYVLDAGGDPVSTGRLLTGPLGHGMANWADLKNQASTLLGIQLVDEDVFSIPMLATDLYGRFIPGINGYPQIVLDDGSLLEGDPTANGGLGVLLPKGLPAGTGNSIPTGHAFLLDIAHYAVPGGTCDYDNDGGALTPEVPIVADIDPGTTDDGEPCTYDDEMLDAHYQAGDGRANENIALTSVHHVFHSEHNRMVQHIKDQVTTLARGAMLADWELSPGVWDGERLFQAAKFVTEMQYQHLAFEEFARKVQPNINAFTGYDPTINPAISAEFAHAVYRFGHSMLTETVDRYDTVSGAPNHLFLLDAFLVPPEWDQNGTVDPDEAAGGILAGAVAQKGQEIDEFVTPALQTNLLGLPLDLAALNIARGRDAGIPPLNQTRRELFVLANSDPSLAPYESWMDFRSALRNTDSIVNFVAAYGRHPFITSHDDGSGPGTMSSRREAADIILNQPGHLDRPADSMEFMWSIGPWANAPGGVTITGLDDVDLWMGGLAESPEIFGGLLGSTFNFVFELQMENLQDGDRFYYLHRLAGTNLLATLEGNSFAELIERNTNADMLPADVFSVPTYVFDLNVVNPGGPLDPLVDDPDTGYDETVLLLKEPDGTVRYDGAEHALFYGRPGNGLRLPPEDDVRSGDGDDTLRGNDGNDRLEGGGGNDQTIGGLGDDIITDSFGDDVLKGGPGNDAIHGGPGIDLLMGGIDHDFIVLGSDLGEILAGSGNDFLQGGASADVLLGEIGDDWVHGGAQTDEVIGDMFAPFENNPLNADGHDVLDGGGGDDSYMGEGGDDWLIAGEGTERLDGGFGFDFVTNRGATQALDADLLRIPEIAVGIAPLADRYELVEAVSGWIHDDVIRGDHRGNGLGPCDPLAIVCGPLLDNELDAAGIARVTGLADLLPAGAVGFTDGNILLGGAGSDTFEGRGSDDIIDGDRWLNVQLMAPDPAGAPGAMQLVDDLADLQADVFAGLINPGDITIVRSVEPGTPGSDVDVAEYGGPAADYNVVDMGDRVLVQHARGCADPTGGDPCPDRPDGTVGIHDGTDTLFNIEILRFSDQDLPVGAGLPTGFLRATTTPALPAQIELNGVPADTWGLTWVELPQGTQNVCFTDIEGYTTPLCQNVAITDGATTVVDGAYQQRGFLRVQTSPPVPATIVVDGERTNDWGVWTHFPATTVAPPGGTVPGPVDVCFGPVAGFTAPPCQLVDIEPGLLTDITAVYTPTPGAPGPSGHGFLRVTSTPALPTQITIDGAIADSWGLNWVKLPANVPGDVYTVCFSDVQGYSTPACQDVVITAGATTVVDGAFTQRGTLQVQTSPAQASTILVDGVRRNAWGMWTDLEPGTYEVCFTELPGFTPPCQTNVIVTAGANTIIVGS